MIEVLIVDDHQLMRQGLRQILEDTDDIVAADEAQDGQQAIEKGTRPALRSGLA